MTDEVRSIIQARADRIVKNITIGAVSEEGGRGSFQYWVQGHVTNVNEYEEAKTIFERTLVRSDGE